MKQTEPSEEQVLIDLQMSLDAYKKRLKDIGEWQENEGMRIQPRVDLGKLDHSHEILVEYAKLLPELERRGWITRAGDQDTEGYFYIVDITKYGQEKARQLINDV